MAGDRTVRLAGRGPDDDGTELVVEPHTDYEAWQIAGPDNALVVCPAGGGEPVVWS